MAHLQNIPLSPLKARGGRISSPRLRTSLAQSEDFTGLEQNANRYDLLLLVKRVGKGAGFSPRMIELLDYYMSFTRAIDWEEGARPLIYQSLARTALDLGVSERQIQKLEKLLFEKGALTWNDSGNHRRYGQRCPETGRIIYAYGVDLTPLAYIKPELEEKLANKKLYDNAWMETKRQISWYRRQIKACISELEGQGAEKRADIEKAIAGYNEIATPIRTYMNLESLRALLISHKELHGSVTDNLPADQRPQKRPVDDSAMTQKSSRSDEQKIVNNKNTTQKQSNKLDTGNAQDKPALKYTGKGGKERKNEAAINDSARIIQETGLENVTVRQVMNVTSERFKELLPLEISLTGSRPAHWRDIVEGAYQLRPQLMISQKSWARACMVLGRTGAAICIILTDQATQRESNRVLKPNAYFNSMITRATKGELKLQSAIFAILKRERDLQC